MKYEREMRMRNCENGGKVNRMNVKAKGRHEVHG